MKFPKTFQTATQAVLVFLLFAGLCGCAAPEPPAPEPPVTVLIVRHAEKAVEPADDPPLTADGQRRAALLARMARSTRASAVYATQYLRTQQTVEPLAAELGLTVQQRDAADVDGLVEQVLAENQGQTVVIAGHSNTVPMLVETLTGNPVQAIEETEYDNLYVVTASAAGQGTAIRLRYGDPSVADAKPTVE